MSRNRIKSANSLPTNNLKRLIAGVLIIVFGAVGYLCLVFKNTALADDNKKQEQALAVLTKENDRRELERQKLTAPLALQRRLAYFRVEMVPLNQLQVLDAQSFHGPGEMVARGKNYPSRAGGN